MSNRLKRIVAFLIDWNITLLPFVLVFGLIAGYLQQQSSGNPIIVIFCFLLILSAFVLFVLRDFVFKGRSLGKRIFGLCVYDKATLQESTSKQRILRNMFFFVYFVDGIILLATGESIGDRSVGTVVLSQKSLDEYKRKHTDSDNSADLLQSPKKNNFKDAVKVVAIIIGCLVVLICLILVLLNAQKDTEEYNLAYNYLITSEAYDVLNTDESKIWMNQYSSTTYSSANAASVTQTVEIGFIVNFKPFEVVCHKENGKWQVCEECTLFD